MAKGNQLLALGLSLSIAMSSSAIADDKDKINNQANTQESCSSKIKAIRDARKQKLDKAKTVFTWTLSPANLIFVLIVPPYAAAVMATNVVGAGGATGILGISYKKAEHVAELFDQAAKGTGDRLDKVWKKFNKKYPLQAKQMSFADFAAKIHQSDLDGSACRENKVPNKGQILTVSMENEEETPVGANPKLSDVDTKTVPTDTPPSEVKSESPQNSTNAVD